MKQCHNKSVLQKNNYTKKASKGEAGNVTKVQVVLLAACTGKEMSKVFNCKHNTFWRKLFSFVEKRRLQVFFDKQNVIVEIKTVAVFITRPYTWQGPTKTDRHVASNLGQRVKLGCCDAYILSKRNNTVSMDHECAPVWMAATCAWAS